MLAFRELYPTYGLCVKMEVEDTHLCEHVYIISGLYWALNALHHYFSSYSFFPSFGDIHVLRF